MKMRPKMSGPRPTSFQAPSMRVPDHSCTVDTAAAAPSQLMPQRRLRTCWTADQSARRYSPPARSFNASKASLRSWGERVELDQLLARLIGAKRAVVETPRATAFPDGARAAVRHQGPALGPAAVAVDLRGRQIEAEVLGVHRRRPCPGDIVVGPRGKEGGALGADEPTVGDQLRHALLLWPESAQLRFGSRDKALGPAADFRQQVTTKFGGQTEAVWRRPRTLRSMWSVQVPHMVGM